MANDNIDETYPEDGVTYDGVYVDSNDFDDNQLDSTVEPSANPDGVYVDPNGFDDNSIAVTGDFGRYVDPNEFDDNSIDADADVAYAEAGEVYAGTPDLSEAYSDSVDVPIEEPQPSEVQSTPDEVSYTQSDPVTQPILVDTPKSKKASKADKKLKKQKKKKGNGTEGIAVTTDIHSEVSDIHTKTDTILYIITDKLSDDIVDYFRSCGLNVTGVFDKIEVVRNILIMQFQATRVMVIDSGTGKFITPTIRKEMIDMIGINDQETKFTVFYTDSVLKSDTINELGKAGREVEWVKYENTAVCVANMLCHNENYVIPAEGSYNLEVTPNEILKYVGETTDDYIPEKMSLPSINQDIIRKNVIDEGVPSLPGFEPHL